MFVSKLQLVCIWAPATRRDVCPPLLLTILIKILSTKYSLRKLLPKSNKSQPKASQWYQHRDKLRRLEMIRNDRFRAPKHERVPLQGFTTWQSIYYHLHNIRQIRKFLTLASTKRLIDCTRRDHGTHLLLQRSSLWCTSCASFQIATSSEFRSATYHPYTQILSHYPSAACTALVTGEVPTEFAINSLWSLSRLFTIWGLRI